MHRLPPLRRSALTLLTVTVFLAGGGCRAEPGLLPSSLPTPFAPAAAVADELLDRLRGGFDDGRGLRASFGIERTIAVNGMPLVVQRVEIADLAHVGLDQAAQLRSLIGGVTLVSTSPGPAATTLPGQGGRGVTTVIQNTLDDQSIRQSTVISAATNSLGAWRRLNAAAALDSALLAPVLPRP